MHISLLGAHAHRTPFAYPVFRELFGRRFTYADTPEEADTIILGYHRNLGETAEQLQALRKARPHLKIVIVSEEPLWDTTNSGDFKKRHNVLKTPVGELPFAVINHHTSGVYKFRRFPYFITTDDKFYLRYSRIYAQNAALSPKALLASWKAAAIRHAFFAENRDLAKKYSVAWPEIETWGLSVYRTDIAKGMPEKGTLRVGAGWGAAVTRQQLPDWHLDKIVTLRGDSTVVSAIENTNHPDYVSEKIFDAFAVRGIPLYWSSPGHRVTDLVTPESFVNLFGLTVAEAVTKITQLRPDLRMAEVHLATQEHLAETFRFYDDYISEREEFVDRLSGDLMRICEEGGADGP